MEKKYVKEELTVVWKPEVCIHSGNCVRGLPGVFKPKEKPWIQLETANVDEIKTAIDRCPSGALSYIEESEAQPETSSSVKVETIPNGPLVVLGQINVCHPDGREEIREKRTTFCRCGHSSNKPFCDGAHRAAGFEG